MTAHKAVCANHPDSLAVGTCPRCGDHVCRECTSDGANCVRCDAIVDHVRKPAGVWIVELWSIAYCLCCFGMGSMLFVRTAEAAARHGTGPATARLVAGMLVIGGLCLMASVTASFMRVRMSRLILVLFHGLSSTFYLCSIGWSLVGPLLTRGGTPSLAVFAAQSCYLAASVACSVYLAASPSAAAWYRRATAPRGGG